MNDELELAQLREESRRSQAECARLLRAQRRRKEFLALATHELRTPLVGLRIYSHFLASGRLGLLSPAQKEKVEAIAQNVERLAHCLESIRRYEWLEAEKIELLTADFDLKTALNEAIASVTRACMEKGISLGQCWNPGAVLVCADRDLIIEVLKNLLDNATAHTPPRGSITVAVTERPGGQVAVSITDSGEGIPPEKMARLFESPWETGEPFTKGHNGLGLGLATVKRILNLHGSRIEVDSKPGSGTRFRFNLALSKEAALAAAAASGAAMLADERRRVILVVDDDDDNLSCMRSVLEFSDYEVLGANGFNEARAQLADGHVEAILLDVALEGTSGLETLRNLKHCPATSNLPVVMVSARADDTARAEAIHAGATGYVVKPYTPANLLRELANALVPHGAGMQAVGM